MPDAAPVRGLWCATLTPIAPEGGVDHARLAAHVRALLAQGVEGVAPFGTTGEGQSFSVAERRAGLDALFASGIAAMHIVAATGCAALTDTLELTRHALSVGCPRCLILPPFFFKDVGDDAIFAYFAEVIERIADPRLRIYLYHIPQVTAVPIRPPIVARLAGEFPGIIAGVKDSSGDLANTLEQLERVPQLSILVGHEPHLPRAMRNGGAGTICGIANLYPGLVRALLRSGVMAHDEARIASLLEILFSVPFLPAFKVLKAAQVDDAQWRAVRPPLVPLSRADREQVLNALGAAGFGVIPAVAQ